MFTIHFANFNYQIGEGRVKVGIILFLCLLMPSTSLAYDFAKDGISYNILSESYKTCEVNDCSATGKISIPNTIDYNGTVYTVTSIREWAFGYCSRLTSIEIPESVDSIGDNAFYGCSRITSIKIPDSVTSIEDGTFYRCSSLATIEIPNSVTSIGNSAFNDCSHLTVIKIPSAVTYIGSSALKAAPTYTN